jgi:hypothetical protein
LPTKRGAIQSIVGNKIGDTGAAVVLAVIFSLATVAIRSRANAADLISAATTFTVFIGTAVYFKRRIGSFSFYFYGLALTTAFVGAVLFGI